MKWKCPECGLENSDKFLECTCGYAFYKMLGVPPGASREEVNQTFRYLKKVWDKNIQSKDPVMKQKAQERMRKIEEAYSIYKHFVTGTPEIEKKSPVIKIASLIGIAILVIAGVVIFFVASRKDTSPEHVDQAQERGVIQSEQSAEQYEPGRAPEQYPEEDYQAKVDDSFSEDISLLRGEERAIALVKRSRGIDRFYSDESQISDWEAKRISDRKYIVSFTASQGSDVSEFYFDTDIRTGSVRNITDTRELQQHGIRGSDFAGYRLDVTVPEYVTENTEFEAQVMITGKPNMEMPVSEKMFFILSNGCEVTAINEKTPRRLSDISTAYGSVKGTPRDPYVPSDDFVVLDSNGLVEIPVTLSVGPYSDVMPKVGAGSEGRGCILDVSVGTFAKVETWVIVTEK
jgi:hypothetical protein